jgi:hypothetical protein
LQESAKNASFHKIHIIIAYDILKNVETISHSLFPRFISDFLLILQPPKSCSPNINVILLTINQAKRIFQFLLISVYTPIYF